MSDQDETRDIPIAAPVKLPAGTIEAVAKSGFNSARITRGGTYPEWDSEETCEAVRECWRTWARDMITAYESAKSGATP